MLKLKIGNSSCTVTGGTSEQLDSLRKVCAYSVSTGHKSPLKGKLAGGKMQWFRVDPRKLGAAKRAGYKIKWIPVKQKRHLMDRKGTFPTGLLYLIEEFIAANRWQVLVDDTRVVPIGIHNLFTIRFED